MIIGFYSSDVLLRHRVGQDCLLPEGLEWCYLGHRFRHRPGGETDGMSSPKFAQVFSAFDQYTTPFLLEAIAHDAPYRDALEIFHTDDGRWHPFAFTREQADEMLLALCLVRAGDDKLLQDEARAIHAAVRFGGQPAWDEHHAAPAVVTGPHT